MSFRTLCFSGLVAVLAGSAAIADNDGSSPPPASQSQMHHHWSRGGEMRLPPELKIMWRREEHARLKSLPKEQRHGWIRSQWAAMTPQQRSKKLAELQAHWKALPSNVRQTVLERQAERHQERRMAAREGQGQTQRGHDNYGQPRSNPQ